MRVKAPSPDPNVGLAQQRQIELAEQQDEFWRENFAPEMLSQMRFGLDLSRRQSDLMERDGEFLRGLALEDRQRYKDTTQRFQDKFYQRVDELGDGEAEGSRRAGQAVADVERNYAENLSAASRGMQRMGINPSSGRYASMIAAQQPGLALAKTQAANLVREAARAEGLRGLSMAAGMNSGDWRGTYGMAQGSGQNAMGMASGGMGMIGQGSSMMNANTGTVGNMWGSVAGIGMNYDRMKYDAARTNAQGFNSIAGSVVGMMSGGTKPWIFGG